ncbi:putative bifunctional diguanylate cyclase/phosphodiesterase [Duganella aceris]|uniref:EAL domain-containing protein n=1 Tax=Duganella aceris TaxID=2703883 RepID=A0ABX0FBU3_9BURK|nr:EAL domain-containing protein [Duganella aceris]
MAVANDIAHWRAQIFARLLLVVFVLGLCTAVPSALLAASEGMWSIVAVDTLALAWIGVVWRWRGLGYTARVVNFLAVAFTVGIALLLKVGPVSQIYLMAVPVLAALLLGLGPALWTLALAGLAVMVLGFDANSRLHIDGMPDSGFLKAAIISLNFMFMTAILTLSCAVLLRHLERSLDSLRALNAELSTTSDDNHRLAFFDVLTGLPNRRLLMDRIDKLLASSERGATYSAVMFIDLDRFKTINDARGHAIGDALLCHAAARLSDLMRKADTVARIGGDEFVVLLAHLSPELPGASQNALLVAEKIRAAISRDAEIEGQIYNSTASIGVTMLPKAGPDLPPQTAQDLLREADTAMYRAKSQGRNGIAFFEAAMQAEVERRLSMERDLAAALGAGQLQMHIQPQVDRNGRTVGGELLMRWPQPDGSMVPPCVFIPVAEDSGLIVELGAWALRQACDAVLRLSAAGLAMPLSVNVSPTQFRQADFVAQVKRTLADSGAPAALLVLEVTEGLLIEKLDDTIARMHQLAALGLRFSIDDFGTGYSSMAYLKKMPLYELKIDRSFIIDTPEDASSSALVQSILAMAGHLGLRVVAEGVETQAQADFLIANDCACMQGYLYARPMPLAALIARLRADAVAAPS